MWHTSRWNRPPSRALSLANCLDVRRMLREDLARLGPAWPVRCR